MYIYIFKYVHNFILNTNHKIILEKRLQSNKVCYLSVNLCIEIKFNFNTNIKTIIFLICFLHAKNIGIYSDYNLTPNINCNAENIINKPSKFIILLI